MDGESVVGQSDWTAEYTTFSATTALAAYKLSLDGNYSYKIERRGTLDVSPPAPPPITPNQGDALTAVLGTIDDASLMSDTDGGTLSSRLRGTNKMLRDIYDQTNHRFKVDGSGVTQPVSGSVSVSNLPASQAVTGTVAVSNLPATQPVSAASLPLPTGAASAANQVTELTSLTTIINRLSGWPTMAPNSCVPVQSAVGGISLTTAGIGYLLAAVRKKTAVGNFVRIKGYEGTIKTNDFLKLSLVLNPTIAGVATFVDVASTPFQSVVGTLLNLVTGGREIDCTYASLNMQNYKSVENLLSQLGATDVIALVGTPALGSSAINVAAYMNVEWV